MPVLLKEENLEILNACIQLFLLFIQLAFDFSTSERDIMVFLTSLATESYHKWFYNTDFLNYYRDLVDVHETATDIEVRRSEFSQNTKGYIKIMTQETTTIWSLHFTPYEVKREKNLLNRRHYFKCHFHPLLIVQLLIS